MSYQNHTIRKKYIIEPQESFGVLRNCAGCGGKTIFRNTGNFRVNANGNRLDVWLIYQCEHCRHTYNLTIYERVRPQTIPAKEYEQFLGNSRTLAFAYGTNAAFFARNKAEVNWNNIPYRIRDVNENTHSRRTLSIEEQDILQQSDSRLQLVIENPHGLRLRADRIAAQLLGQSRSRIKQLMKDGKLEIMM